MREKLIDSIRRQENNQHIESLILVAADYILEHLTEKRIKNRRCGGFHKHVTQLFLYKL